MIVNETAKDGRTVERTTIDAKTGEVIVERDTGKGIEIVERRQLTDIEVAQATFIENSTAIEGVVRQALEINKAFLANEKPSSDDDAGQLQALTRQVSALIRREFGDYTAVD